MIKRTVLVVDDEIINRRILGKILSEDYNVLYASNGLEALTILEEKAESISAILLDIIMPEMDGYGVLSAMKEDRVMSQIPVIVSSQKDNDDSEIKALSLGAQDFVGKPYKADIIKHRIANTIEFRETSAEANKIRKDELTGIFNKQFFVQQVGRTIKQNPDKKYDLVCMDIERFKLINDTYGMKKGDKLLIFVSQKLKEHIGDASICARFDADVFFMLLPHTHEYKNELFEQYIQLVNEFPIDINIKLRFGIYSITDVNVPINIMCDRAQLATDKIKGKYDEWFCYYDDTIRQKMLHEQEITDCMKDSLEQQQFHVYYQPKYELSSETIAGAEALVRWIHPEKGFMNPGDFIPLFEKNGFITQLDMYVWETVCKDMHQWILAGNKPVAVSVNVSRADIFNPRLPEIIMGLVEKYQIPTKYLHLEITESAYTESPDQIIETTAKLSEIGYEICTEPDLLEFRKRYLEFYYQPCQMDGFSRGCRGG